MPRISVNSRGAISPPVNFSTTVRRAASITPPVAPKMTLAPVDTPSRGSNSPSGRWSNIMPAWVMSRASSRVVRDTSTGMQPLASRCSGRLTSYFLAVQGMTDTTKMSLGSMPASWA